MSADTPPLDVSDILVPVHTSPSSQGDNASSPSRNPSPAPVDAGEIEEMRRKVLEVRTSKFAGKKLENTWENELADMVLCLTSSALPSCSQLVTQAETISRLVQQRQFLLDRAEAERNLHKAEKDSWTRTCETLVAQITKGGPSIYRDHDPGNQISRVESDNQILRQKLADAQNRLAALSSELARLKPLLLMQPFALAHSHSSLDAPKLRKKKVPHAEPEPEDPPDEPAPIEDPTTPKQGKSKSGQYYRKRDELLPLSPATLKKIQPRLPLTPKVLGPSVGLPLPLLADARAEHLLLAARKIGRERASLLSAMPYQAARMKERVDEEAPAAAATSSSLQSPSTPKTPRKVAEPITVPVYHSPFAPSPMPASAGTAIAVPSYQPPHPFAYVAGRVYPVYSPAPYSLGPYPMNSPPSNVSPKPIGGPTSNAKASSSSNQLRTPRINANRLQPHPGPPPSPSKSGPPTPLESLLSAARSVLSPASTPSKSKMSSTDESGYVVTPSSDRPNGPTPPRHILPMFVGTPSKGQRFKDERGYVRSAPHDHPESPAPKRRRLATPTVQATAEQSPGVERTMSALDVLADQAMASSPGTSPRPRRASRDQVSDAAAARDVGEGEDASSSPVVSEPPPRFDRKKRNRDRDKSKGKSKALDLQVGVDEATHSDGSRVSPAPAMDTKRSPLLHPNHTSPPLRGGLSVPGSPQPSSGTTFQESRRIPSSPPSSVPPNLRPSNDGISAKADPDTVMHPIRSGNAERADPPRSDAQLLTQSRSASVDPAQSKHLRTRSVAPIDVTLINRGEVFPTSTSRRVNGSRNVSLEATANRGRSPALWSKEEDDMLSDAVAVHGHKWDQVQKSLPTKGPDQVRQRWLRKLGMPEGGRSVRGTTPIPILNLIPPSSDTGMEVAYGRSSTPDTDPADEA